MIIAYVRNRNWRVLRAYTASTAITNWKTLLGWLPNVQEWTVILTGQEQRYSDTRAFWKRQHRKRSYFQIHHRLPKFVVPSKTARPRWQDLSRSQLGPLQHRNGKQWIRGESSKAGEKRRQDGREIFHSPSATNLAHLFLMDVYRQYANPPFHVYRRIVL